jgi:hypothetical protein
MGKIRLHYYQSKANIEIQAPTRSVTGRYCSKDFVLAVVGRLHEVVGGANMGGIAGLGKTSDDVAAIGIENIDLKSVMEGNPLSKLLGKACCSRGSCPS